MKIKIKEFTKKPEFIVLGLSLLFTGVISTVVGLGGMLLSLNFWGMFCFAFSVQFVVFFVINTILQKKDEAITTKLINEQLNALSKYVVRLTCSYCDRPNSVPIVLNRENRYKCEFCQQTNGVKMQFISTQITTPLEKIILPVSPETTN
jgi:hypothetical protein